MQQHRAVQDDMILDRAVLSFGDLDRENGATQHHVDRRAGVRIVACRYVRDLDFPTSETAFDVAFRQDE